MGRKLTAAIVGLGQIGCRYQETRPGIVTHAQMYHANPSFDLIAGFDPNQRQRKFFSKKYPQALTFSNLNKMMVEMKPDVVSIASPPEFHLANIKAVLAHHPKAIFCEKPLAASVTDAKLIQKIVNKHKTYFQVNYSRRFDKTHQSIKKDIVTLRWGTPRLIEGYVSGAFTSMASHLIDTMMWYFGPVSVVQTIGPFKNIDMPGSVRLVFKSGIAAWIHTLPKEDYLIYELDMYFSKARIRLASNGFESQVWQKSPSKLFAGYQTLKPTTSIYPKGYQNVFENAGQHIKSLKHSPCTVWDGLASLQVMDAILRSAKNNNKVIRIKTRGQNR